jgi:hypothetical protein
MKNPANRSAESVRPVVTQQCNDRAEMQNKILLKRQALEAARATLNYKIQNLKKFFSREQVRCWYIQRDRIVFQLRQLPTEEQIQANAKRINYSNSTKYWK